LSLSIRTRRWNDPAEPGDGTRILVCRYRPRGLPKADETWDEWMQELGPSRELHAAAYGKHEEAIAWDDYVRRYRMEMTRQEPAILALAARVKRGEDVTLLCSSACLDENRCHRTLLAELIREAMRSL
jgi:uncharacterized protein YeaO (DUF488 family)